MPAPKKQERSFEILEEVDADQVPNWTRRPKLYSDIIEALEKLAVGRSLKIRFPSHTKASQARNSIRDYWNRMAAFNATTGKATQLPGMIATRVEDQDDGSAIAYFTMQEMPEDIQASAQREAGKGKRK